MILLHSEKEQQSLSQGNAADSKRASKLKFRKTVLTAVLAAAFVSISSAQAASTVHFTDTIFDQDLVVDSPSNADRIWQWNGEHSGEDGYMAAGASIKVNGGTDIDAILTDTNLTLDGTAENKIIISNESNGYAVGVLLEGKQQSESANIVINYAEITANSSSEATAIANKKLQISDADLAPTLTINNSDIYGAAAAIYNWSTDDVKNWGGARNLDLKVQAL